MIKVTVTIERIEEVEVEIETYDEYSETEKELILKEITTAIKDR